MTSYFVDCAPKLAGRRGNRHSDVRVVGLQRGGGSGSPRAAGPLEQVACSSLPRPHPSFHAASTLLGLTLLIGALPSGFRGLRSGPSRSRSRRPPRLRRARARGAARRRRGRQRPPSRAACPLRCRRRSWRRRRGADAARPGAAGAAILRRGPRVTASEGDGEQSGTRQRRRGAGKSRSREVRERERASERERESARARERERERERRTAFS